MVNVTRSNFSRLEAEGNVSNQGVIIASVVISVLFILTLILTYYLISLRWKEKNEDDSKKVSRAKSWRYESSMYINPPNNRQKILYVPPPPIPPGLSSTYSTNSRTRTNSTHSSPTQPRPPLLQEVDLVRTSMPPSHVNHEY